ncbi:sulfurtransferase [Bacillus sp. V5-8f]|uniref:sulfurtransferase n=1 Tax=Bacillus sp. V5-8f TaxID=2053044 RepID=UPI000C78DD2C|nr:sulfurtransferase [Bacillus sp. V5-8f]PLT32451.1 sulfurtransferase [Bacillus sp. V5-8f]
MLISVFFLTVAILGTSIYNRYVPVQNVRCNDTGFHEPDTTILDIRDYNNKANDIKRESLNIPYAYLRRFNSEITPGKIHVIASNRLELNLGIRFLKRKGFNVTSYEISNGPGNEKGGIDHGV